MDANLIFWNTTADILPVRIDCSFNLSFVLVGLPVPLRLCGARAPIEPFRSLSWDSLGFVANTAATENVLTQIGLPLFY